jgi:hypothetical protein
MEMRLRELNKINEEKAIANMISQFEAMMPTMFDFKLKLGEPRRPQERRPVPGVHSTNYTPQGVYEIPAKISVIPNKNATAIIDILFKTLNSLALSNSDLANYRTANLQTYNLKIGNATDGSQSRIFASPDGNPYTVSPPYSFDLRSDASRTVIREFFNDKIYDAVFGFKIVDNLGQISSIESAKLVDVTNTANYRITGKGTGIMGFWLWADGRGSDNCWNWSAHHISKRCNDCVYIPFLSIRNNRYRANRKYEIQIFLDIPEKDITKYNKFTISQR